MSKELKISRELSLPLEAVTEKFAFLGKSGSGKTYASMKLCELMLEVGMQVIVLDLVGPWYGLRISADGKGKGFEIPIFGGLHGDFELHPELGEHVAEIIVERGISAVIDISQMIDSEQTKFATAFGRRFYDLKKRRPSAVHLFMEECELLVPQNPEKDETKKLNIYKRIVKIGRNFGIGCSQISQRPQDINKKALNQTEVLFVFQTTGPHERKAVMEWMRDKEITDVGYSDLAKLEKGVARVWSPSWLKVSKTLKVDKKITFDSSATPKYGETRTEEPKKLTDDDIIKIREMIDSARRKMLEPEKTEKRKPGKSLKSEDQLNSAEIDSLRGENETLRQNIQQETEARRLEIGRAHV